ncbi:MAG: hypothetical protein HND55_13495 [Pseudomonadota bacterium]|nr:MAG: hypothetical protein HND55_13495 [Pseudomonadota bacterium]
MTFNPIGDRLAIVATLVLGLFLLAGCSDEPDAHASAAEDATERREVVLSVPDMTCPTCPITVRRSLRGVDGVYEAEVDFETKQARAVFDPARTDVDMLIAAVENSGFSATLKSKSNE